MDADAYRRNRSLSQPRFDDFGSLDRRSRSLDARRWQQPPAFDYGTLQHDASRDRLKPPRESFLNETITIPIRQEGTMGAHFSPALAPRRYQSALGLSSREAASAEVNNEDEDFTRYDRSVKYNHERKVYPPPPAYSDWSSRYTHRDRSGYYPPAYSSGERRSEYGVAAAQDQYGTLGRRTGGYQHQHHRQASDYQHRDLQQQQKQHQGLYGTYGRSAGGGGGHRSQYHHHHSSSQHRSHNEGAGNASAAARYQQQQQQQQYASNGWSAHQRRAASSGGGTMSRSGGQHRSFFGGGGRQQGGWSEQRYGTKGQGQYYKVRCCCFPCIWPPWAVDPHEPPRPMYAARKQGPGSRGPTSPAQSRTFIPPPGSPGQRNGPGRMVQNGPSSQGPGPYGPPPHGPPGQHY